MNIERKISFYLQKVYTRDSNEMQIRMRVRWNGNIAQFNIGHNIAPDKWDSDKNCCKIDIVNNKGISANEINKSIQQFQKRADETFSLFENKEIVPTLKEYKLTFESIKIKTIPTSDNVLLSINKSSFKNYLTAKQVHELMPFWSIRTISYYASQGKIPCIRFGRKVFFIKEDIEKFVESITTKVEGNYNK